MACKLTTTGLIVATDPLINRHRVEQYGVKLFVGGRDGKGKDEHAFTFHLRRLDDQPGMEKALLRPASDELDDWKDYLYSKHAQQGSDLTSLQTQGSKASLRKREKLSQYWFNLDSGYDSWDSSRRPSKQSDC